MSAARLACSRPDERARIPHRRRLRSACAQAIVRGELRPNERLIETDLAEQLEISRTPIREVFHRLGGEGLIVRVRRGWRVREHTPGRDRRDLRGARRARGLRRRARRRPRHRRGPEPHPGDPPRRGQPGAAHRARPSRRGQRRLPPGDPRRRAQPAAHPAGAPEPRVLLQPPHRAPVLRRRGGGVGRAARGDRARAAGPRRRRRRAGDARARPARARADQGQAAMTFCCRARLRAPRRRTSGRGATRAS